MESNIVFHVPPIHYHFRFAKLLESLKARQEILDDLSQRMDALREIEALTSSLKELEPQLEAKVLIQE